MGGSGTIIKDAHPLSERTEDEIHPCGNKKVIKIIEHKATDMKSYK
jgi:hypothetical protein